MALGVIANLTSCSATDSEDKTTYDQEKPTIEDSEQSTPTDCQQFMRGESIKFRYTFADNVELGNFNIEIHNNFDHHTHSTSAADCQMEAIKPPENPWVYNQDHSIDPGLKKFEANIEIPIPYNVDPGDYHFMIRVTDRAGWQTLKAISVKIL